ncbi:hypothetical protein KBA27_03070, partial [bacterium]|nr:hypothetical protein [bacterium]
MANSIVNLFSRAFIAQTQNVQSTTALTRKANSGNNPFMNASSVKASFSSNYAKNTPVAGGYFAGYYNNKPNIVG